MQKLLHTQQLKLVKESVKMLRGQNRALSKVLRALEDILLEQELRLMDLEQECAMTERHKDTTDGSISFTGITSTTTSAQKNSENNNEK